MKTDLLDVTFLIPFRADSIRRIENLMMVVRYLLQGFNTHVIVLQADEYENGVLPMWLPKPVTYHFVEDRDSVYYKTKYQNQLTRLATTPFLCTLDADIIIPRQQIEESVCKLREGYDIVYPYDGHVYDTTEGIRERFFLKKDNKILLRHQNKMRLIYGTLIKGGAMFVNKAAYVQGGMENEKFYGWGNEDIERYERWKNLHYRIYCCLGCLYHLTHPKGMNSNFRSYLHQKQTIKELFLSKRSSEEELKTNSTTN
jgi:hypothetical protein